VIHNSRKLLPHQRAAGARIKFIHLIRDGRAVTASMLRKRWKNRITSMWRAARQWRYDVRRNHRLLKRQPAADQIMVRYEDLIADRHAELSRICDFLGMQYDPTMIEFWNGDHHPAGGNAGTMFSMAREKESAGEAARADQIAHRVDPQRLDVNYYEEQDPGQFRDERWKNELSDRDLRIFGLIAGRLNRQFGYPPSLERRDTASVPVGV